MNSVNGAFLEKYSTDISYRKFPAANTRAYYGEFEEIVVSKKPTIIDGSIVNIENNSGKIFKPIGLNMDFFCSQGFGYFPMNCYYYSYGIDSYKYLINNTGAIINSGFGYPKETHPNAEVYNDFWNIEAADTNVGNDGSVSSLTFSDSISEKPRSEITPYSYIQSGIEYTRNGARNAGTYPMVFVLVEPPSPPTAQISTDQNGNIIQTENITGFAGYLIPPRYVTYNGTNYNITAELTYDSYQYSVDGGQNFTTVHTIDNSAPFDFTDFPIVGGRGEESRLVITMNPSFFETEDYNTIKEKMENAQLSWYLKLYGDKADVFIYSGDTFQKTAFPGSPTDNFYAVLPNNSNISEGSTICKNYKDNYVNSKLVGVENQFAGLNISAILNNPNSGTAYLQMEVFNTETQQTETFFIILLREPIFIPKSPYISKKPWDWTGEQTSAAAGNSIYTGMKCLINGLEYELVEDKITYATSTDHDVQQVCKGFEFAADYEASLSITQALSSGKRVFNWDHLSTTMNRGYYEFTLGSGVPANGKIVMRLDTKNGLITHKITTYDDSGEIIEENIPITTSASTTPTIGTFLPAEEVPVTALYLKSISNSGQAISPDVFYENMRVEVYRDKCIGKLVNEEFSLQDYDTYTIWSNTILTQQYFFETNNGQEINILTGENTAFISETTDANNNTVWEFDSCNLNFEGWYNGEILHHKWELFKNDNFLETGEEGFKLVEDTGEIYSTDLQKSYIGLDISPSSDNKIMYKLTLTISNSLSQTVEKTVYFYILADVPNPIEISANIDCDEQDFKIDTSKFSKKLIIDQNGDVVEAVYIDEILSTDNGVLNIPSYYYYGGKRYVIKAIENGAWDNVKNQIETLAFPGDIPLPASASYYTPNLKICVLKEGRRDLDSEEFFQGSTSLEEVIVPNTITTIGTETFRGCINLVTALIPTSVINIKSGAFYGCTSLPNAIIPDSVVSIGDNAFRDCSSLQSAVIGRGVTTFGNNIFNGCTSLENVIIPKNITHIGTGTFKNCTALTSITIPDSVTSIGTSAFEGCTNLKTVVIPNSVTTIESSAFKNCTALTSITIPDSVTSIGKNVFEGCSDLKSITIPNSVTSIGYNAFLNTSWYNSQQDGVVYAGKVAYQYKGTMPENTEIVLKDDTKGIADRVFYNRDNLISLTFPSSVENIGDYAFYSCNGLTSITIPDSVTSIGKNVFEGCTNLKTVVIPNSVTTIESSTFKNCTALTSITIPDSVTSIGASAFNGCSNLTSITIPDGVTSIGNFAFCDCSSLETIIIPDSVTSIGWNAFYNTSWYNGQQEGLVYAGRVAYRYKGTMPENTEIELIEGTRGIADDAFTGCTNLISIGIPNGVVNIGIGAFYNCSNLVAVVIPDGVLTIRTNTFYGCASLERLEIPLSVTKIDSGAFNRTNTSKLIIYYQGTQTQWKNIEGVKLNVPSTITIVYGEEDIGTEEIIGNNTNLVVPTVSVPPTVSVSSSTIPLPFPNQDLFEFRFGADPEVYITTTEMVFEGLKIYKTNTTTEDLTKEILISDNIASFTDYALSNYNNYIYNIRGIYRFVDSNKFTYIEGKERIPNQDIFAEKGIYVYSGNLDKTSDYTYHKFYWSKLLLLNTEKRLSDDLEEGVYYISSSKYSKWDFHLDLEEAEITIGTDSGQFEGISKYPRVNETYRNFKSQSLNCDLGKIDNSTDWRYGRSSVMLATAWQDFCNNGCVKIIRDYYGNLLPVKVTAKSYKSTNTQPTLMKIAFEWVQVAKGDEIFAIETYKTTE